MTTIEQQIANARVDKSRPDWRTRLPKPTAATFDPSKRVFAVVETSEGTFGIHLLADGAPMHVTSFAYLAGLGFFDGLAFHRVIDGFMAQGGCPIGNGTGGPGYRMDGEYPPGFKHDRRGVLSAANAGPGTDGSQFFLTFVETPWLDGKHTVFGRVTEGLDVLDKLEAGGTQSGKPKKKMTIDRVRIEERA